MAVHLSCKQIIARTDLLEIGDARLGEARSLLASSHYAGAVYLAGYAVECHLKAVICRALDLPGLPELFKTHDLEGLLLYSGLSRKLDVTVGIATSFREIVGVWVMDRREINQGGKQVVVESVRYRSPSEFDETTAARFLECVGDPNIGVVPWLRTMI